MERKLKCTYCGEDSAGALFQGRVERFFCETEVEYTPTGYRWTQSDECKADEFEELVEAWKADAARRIANEKETKMEPIRDKCKYCNSLVHEQKGVKATVFNCDTIVELNPFGELWTQSDGCKEFEKDEKRLRSHVLKTGLPIQPEPTRPPPTNHDTHYAEKDVQPIDIMEETIERLIAAGVSPRKALNTVLALKYQLRAGLKDGEDPDKDLRKAANYQHRAETGGWL